SRRVCPARGVSGNDCDEWGVAVDYPEFERRFAAFAGELWRLGWIEGDNVTFAVRHAVALADVSSDHRADCRQSFEPAKTLQFPPRFRRRSSRTTPRNRAAGCAISAAKSHASLWSRRRW